MAGEGAGLSLSASDTGHLSAQRAKTCAVRRGLTSNPTKALSSAWMEICERTSAEVVLMCQVTAWSTMPKRHERSAREEMAALRCRAAE